MINLMLNNQQIAAPIESLPTFKCSNFIQQQMQIFTQQFLVTQNRMVNTSVTVTCFRLFLFHIKHAHYIHELCNKDFLNVICRRLSKLLYIRNKQRFNQ